MGTIGAAPSPPGRSGGGPSSPAGWIVAGVLGIAFAALLAFQAGKRSTDRGAAVAVPVVAQVSSDAGERNAVHE